MSKKDMKINKEELTIQIGRLKEIFAPFVAEREKDAGASGLVERWIYELSSGEEKVLKAAVSLLNRSKIDFFARTVELMTAHRLPGSDEILEEIIENEKTELEKRIRAYDILSDAGVEIKKGHDAYLESIVTLKKSLMASLDETKSGSEVRSEELLGSSDEKQCWLALILLSEQVEKVKFLQILENISGFNTTVDLNIASLLSLYGSQECLALLEKIYRNTESKEVQKQVNRALFILKQKGLGVDAASFKAEKKAVLKPVQAESLGYISTPMGLHIQLLFFAFYQPLSGHYLFNAVKDFKNGLIDFYSYRTSKKGIKKYVEYLQKERGTQLFSISAGHCLFLLEESVETAKLKGKEIPGTYGKWIDIIKNNIQLPVEPEIYRNIDRERIRNISISDAIKNLGDTDISLLNLIDEEELAAVYGRFRDAEDGVIVVDQATKEERTKGAVKEIAESLYTPALRNSIRRKIEELSLILFLSGRTEEAENFVRLAIDIEETSVPSQSIFLINLLESSLKRYGEIKKKKQEDNLGPSVIVKPTAEKI